MELTPSVSDWLPWLGRVRFLIITVLVTVVVAVRQLTPIPLPVRTVLPWVTGWYTLAIIYVILQHLFPGARWQAPLQMVLDLAIITGVVYSTGAQDSYFLSLYLLAILMGSILFTRRGAFLVAGASFLLLACVLGLSNYGIIPHTSNSVTSPRSLAFWLASNFFAFFA